MTAGRGIKGGLRDVGGSYTESWGLIGGGIQMGRT